MKMNHSPGQNGHSPRQKCVFLVDDDAEYHEMLRQAFADTKQLVLAELVLLDPCLTGAEALARIPGMAPAPDLVLMDLNLPDMTGIACAAKLRLLLRNTPVLMLTNQAADERALRCILAGVSGWVLKTDGLDAVLKAIHEAVDALPEPKIVIAVGACAIAGGPFVGHPQILNGAAAVVPVDLYIPGCPPHPITILDGLLRQLDRLEKKQERS